MGDLKINFEPSLELRIAEFKSDPEKMKDLNEFISGIIEKAKVQAEQRTNGKQKTKLDTSALQTKELVSVKDYRQSNKIEANLIENASGNDNDTIKINGSDVDNEKEKIEIVTSNNPTAGDTQPSSGIMYELKVDRYYILNKNLVKNASEIIGTTYGDNVLNDVEELSAEYSGGGSDAQTMRENQDYNLHQIDELKNLSHVIELYDFPKTFVTQDIIHIYHPIHRDPIYVKWCDDIHALLTLSSAEHAERALLITHPLIKSRRMTEASPVASLIAHRCDLKPATRRLQSPIQSPRWITENRSLVEQSSHVCSYFCYSGIYRHMQLHHHRA